MTDFDGQLHLIPESLKLFLKSLQKQYRPSAFWVQRVIKTSKRKSEVLPLSMRFTLQRKHRFGFK